MKARTRSIERLLSAARSKQTSYLLNIMTSATDSDIREIRTAVESIAKATEANTKAISDLTLEMRVGFSDLKGQINTLEAKIEGKIDKVDAKYEERTKLGFWGFIFRGSALAVLAAILVIFVKYLFPILPTELPKL